MDDAARKDDTLGVVTSSSTTLLDVGISANGRSGIDGSESQHGKDVE
jgi:hypothetical protein